ncbi:hypothetical protein Pcinc_000801 [Petrolisthes cinctipes]|uniref:Uncharacterized protein n=1 Tax=Petrolisthes cinctipes TaxID=88211 RepID=A0AAE1GPF1_PETCI|nr:hypothetical protein Pcinc_000801 [Petrolisthes cinctipes]
MSRNDQNSQETIDSGRQKTHPVELHELDGSETEDDIDLGDTFMGSLEDINAVALETVDSQKLKQLQSEDPEIEKLKSEKGTHSSSGASCSHGHRCKVGV